jgi:A/G-specific adenine glycosylase
MELSQEHIADFQRRILSWYRVNKRELPWRRDREAYHIFVSEIMLQQTQVARVISKYEAFLDAFPTICDLADAKPSAVLRLWSGLGYNRRAMYLQKAAQSICCDLRGVWPRTVEELKKLPGVGEYTARAIACLAFDQQIAVLDANVRRVILTQFQKSHYTSYPPSMKELQGIADQLLPFGKAYEWNQALMDYSSVELVKEKIPVVRQSAFKGSRRYVRGSILKYLVAHTTRKERDFCHLLPEYSRETIVSVLSDLLEERMIWKKGDVYSLFGE